MPTSVSRGARGVLLAFAGLIGASWMVAACGGTLLFTGETLRSRAVPGMLLTPDNRQVGFVGIITDLIAARYKSTDTIELDPATGRYRLHVGQQPFDVIANRLSRAEQIRTVAVYSLETPRFRVGQGRLAIDSVGAITYVGPLNYNAFKDVSFDSAARSDFDDDGISDAYEQANALNPFNPNDASLDDDGDGLSNLEEFLASTDAQNPDTDGDGIIDGLDPEPTVDSNLCFGDDAVLEGVAAFPGDDLTCGARRSVTADAIFIPAGAALLMLSPKVYFRSETRIEPGGDLWVLPIDPTVPQ